MSYKHRQSAIQASLLSSGVVRSSYENGGASQSKTLVCSPLGVSTQRFMYF